MTKTQEKTAIQKDLQALAKKHNVSNWAYTANTTQEYIGIVGNCEFINIPVLLCNVGRLYQYVREMVGDCMKETEKKMKEFDRGK